MPISAEEFRKLLYCPCQDCGGVLFRIRMDDDWNGVDYKIDNLNGQIECVKCGAVFLELGR